MGTRGLFLDSRWRFTGKEVKPGKRTHAILMHYSVSLKSIVASVSDVIQYPQQCSYRTFISCIKYVKTNSICVDLQLLLEVDHA